MNVLKFFKDEFLQSDIEYIKKLIIFKLNIPNFSSFILGIKIKRYYYTVPASLTLGKVLTIGAYAELSELEIVNIKPSTARPSECFKASTTSGYFLFQWTKCTSIG